MTSKPKDRVVVMTFEVTAPFDFMIDEDSFKKDFNNDVFKLAEWLYTEENHWWDEEMKLVKAEIKSKPPKNKVDAQ